MAATPRKAYRIPSETLAKMAALSERWGGIKPAGETAVLIEAVSRAYAAEFGPPKRTPKPKA